MRACLHQHMMRSVDVDTWRVPLCLIQQCKARKANVVLGKSATDCRSRKCRKIVKTDPNLLFWFILNDPGKCSEKCKNADFGQLSCISGKCSKSAKSKISKMLPKSTKMLQNDASSKHFVHYLIKIWARPSAASKRRRRPSAAAFFWFHI